MKKIKSNNQTKFIKINRTQNKFLSVVRRRPYFLVIASLLIGAVGYLILNSSSATTTIPTIPSTGYSIPTVGIVKYVAPNGNDNNTSSEAGSEGSPYKTIKKGISATPAGATLVLEAGVYREGELATTKQITIMARPGAQVWIDGTDVIANNAWVLNSTTGKYETTWHTPKFCSAWTGSTFDEQYYNATGLGLKDVNGNPIKANGVQKKDTLKCAHEDMSLDESNPMAWDPQAMYIDGQNLTQVDSLTNLNSNTEFYYSRNGASSKLVLNFKPSTQLVEATKRPSFLILAKNKEISTSAGSRLIGIGVRKFATNQYPGTTTNGAIYVTTPNVTLDKVVVWHNSGTGIVTTESASDVIMKNIILKDNGFNGAVSNKSPNITVQDSVISYNNREKFGKYCSSSCADAGIKMAHMEGATIKYNIFDTNNGHGYWCDLDCKDIDIFGNTFVNNTESGIMYEVSTRGNIVSNVIANNKGPGIRICSSASKIYNNTIIDNAKEGIWLYEDQRIAGEPPNPSIADSTDYDSNSNEVINNIFSGNLTNSIRVDAQQLYKKTISGSTSGKNGTYTHTSTLGNPVRYFENNKLDYNVYSKSPSSKPAEHIKWGKVTNTNLTTVVSNPKDGADTLTITKYNQTVDNSPQFINISNFRSNYGQFEVNHKESSSANDPLFYNYISPGAVNNDYRVVSDSTLAYNNGMPLPASIATLVGKPSSYQAGRGAISWVNQNKQMVTSPVIESTNRPPTTPTNFTSNNVTSSSATLRWTASTDPNGDQFSYTLSQGATVVATNIPSATTSYSLSGLTAGADYSYSLQAIDSKGAKSTVATTTFTTSNTTPIPAGLFKVPYNGSYRIYNSNGSAYCFYDTWELFTSLTGRTSATDITSYDTIPTTMTDLGVCQSATKLGDINGDNKVDIFDLSILLNKWNSNDINSDLNNDGMVSVFDLSILLTNWTIG